MSISVKKIILGYFSFIEVKIPNKPSDWHFMLIFKSRRIKDVGIHLNDVSLSLFSYQTSLLQIIVSALVERMGVISLPIHSGLNVL